MHQIKKIEKYILISNGIGLIHRVHNTINSVTQTGQPFMLLGESEEALNDLWYSAWSYVIEEDDSEEEVGTLIGTEYPVTWVTGHETLEEAQATLDLVMAVLPIVKIIPVKHPDRDEWANPFQEKVFNEISDEDIKNQVLGIIADNVDNIRTKEQMFTDEWF